MKYILSIFVLALCVSSAQAGFYTKCDRGVMLGDPNSLKNISGNISCYDDKNLIVESATLDKGEIIKDTKYENSIKASVESYKNGKKNGISETYYPDGKLKESYNYSNDELDGINRQYFEDGKTISHLGYDKSGSPDASSYVNFNKQNNPTNVSCGKQIASEFKKFCSAPVQLYDDENNKTRTYLPEGVKFTGTVKHQDGGGNVTREVEYKNGEQSGEKRDFDKNGNLLMSENFAKGDFSGEQKIYFENSKQVKSIVHVNSETKIADKEEAYYMNGQLRASYEEIAGNKYILKEYYDNGKPKLEAIYNRRSSCYTYFCFDSATGESESYDKDGKLEISTHDEKGHIIKTVKYDASGKETETKNFFPDGSEKH